MQETYESQETKRRPPSAGAARPAPPPGLPGLVPRRGQLRDAAVEGVDPGQITHDVATMLTEVHGRRVDIAEEENNRLLAEIDWQLQELRAAWERSKKPKDRKRAKRSEGLGRDGKGERRDAETVTEGRDGTPSSSRRSRGCRSSARRCKGWSRNATNTAAPTVGPSNTRY